MLLLHYVIPYTAMYTQKTKKYAKIRKKKTGRKKSSSPVKRFGMKNKPKGILSRC